MNHSATIGLAILELEPATIPSSYTRLIGRELDLQARDLPKLLKFTALTPEQLMLDETLLTATQQIQILKNAIALSTGELFGLSLGQRLTPSTHGAMGFLVNSCPNLWMALQAFQVFLPTRMSLISLKLRHDPMWTECLIQFEQTLDAAVQRTAAEAIAVILFECAEFIVGRPLTEATTQFTHAAPDYHARYADYFAGTYGFGAANFSIRFPTEICQIANASSNHDSYLLAMQQCETILNQLSTQQHSITYQVQKIMLSHPLGQPSETDIAAALFMNKRTLARRLDAEDTSYRQIRDKILAQQASGYLCNSQMSVDAIACLLGYHDAANFRRAFKRWFRMSPSAYRQQQLSP